jgi:hypothetical protein
MPSDERLLRIIVAIAIVGGPLGYLFGGALSPSVHRSGAETIASSSSANPGRNVLPLIAFFAASFLPPVGAAALEEDGGRLGVGIRGHGRPCARQGTPATAGWIK